MTSIRTALVLGVVMVALSLAAACGGSGTARPATMSPAAFTRQADALCATLNHLSAVAGQRDTSRSAAMAAVHSVFDAGLVRLRGLHPDPARAVGYAAFLAATARQRPPLVAYESAPSAAPLGTLFVQVAAAGQIAARIGLPTCALQVDTSQPPATAKQYRLVIDGECYEGSAAARALPRPTQLSDLPAFTVAADPIFAQVLRDVRAQPQPRSGAPSIQTWISAVAKDKAAIDAAGAAATTGNTTAFKVANSKAILANRAAATAAQADGIPNCSSGI